MPASTAAAVATAVVVASLNRRGGEIQGRVRVRGLPEDTAVIRLRSWLNDTEVMAMAAVTSADRSPQSADRSPQEDEKTVYAVDVTTGETRMLDSYPPFPHILIPGIVM
nr:hypothetical protein GCM10020093_083860 [Planobispora longispora]